MVDPDAGLAPMEADGKDPFRSPRLVADAHGAVHAHHRRTGADPRSRIAWERGPRDRFVRTTEVPARDIRTRRRDDPACSAAGLAAGDDVPRARAHAASFALRYPLSEGSPLAAARMRQVREARDLDAIVDASREAVGAVGPLEARAAPLRRVRTEPHAPALASLTRHETGHERDGNQPEQEAVLSHHPQARPSGSRAHHGRAEAGQISALRESRRAAPTMHERQGSWCWVAGGC